MPTFCRHNRFIERCPICSKTLPGHAESRRSSGASRPEKGSRRRTSSTSDAGRPAAARRSRSAGVRVYGDGRKRERDDGYDCELLPGLRSSQEARQLLDEIAFASARLQTLAASPPGVYALVAELHEQGDFERASWLCFLIAYLSPLDGDSPFTAISNAPSSEEVSSIEDERIEALALGPRTCHEQGRGSTTMRAYLAWAGRAGSQRSALTGEESWGPERRFERVFERLSIPGFPRWGRYELLVLLGGLGLCELRADSLHLSGASPGDPVLGAAKRAFGIGDPMLLERRVKRLAEEIPVRLEALDLALFNWFVPERATAGFADGLRDADTIEWGQRALGF